MHGWRARRGYGKLVGELRRRVRRDRDGAAALLEVEARILSLHAALERIDAERALLSLRRRTVRSALRRVCELLARSGVVRRGHPAPLVLPRGEAARAALLAELLDAEPLGHAARQVLEHARDVVARADRAADELAQREDRVTDALDAQVHRLAGLLTAP